MTIRDYRQQDLESVVQLSLRAWAPVFVSIEHSMDPDVYQFFFPDWRSEQANSVADVCRDENAKIWVAEIDAAVVGFVAAYERLPKYGEIYMIAVDPDAQRQNIGKALTEHATGWMRDNGILVAMVETGGDPGHAPARRLYEKAGFRLWPVARYYKSLK